MTVIPKTDKSGQEIPLYKSKTPRCLENIPPPVKITVGLSLKYVCVRVTIMDASMFTICSSFVTTSIIETLNCIVLSLPLNKLNAHAAMLIGTTCNFLDPCEIGWIVDHLSKDIQRLFCTGLHTSCDMNTIFIPDVCEVACLPKIFRKRVVPEAAEI